MVGELFSELTVKMSLERRPGRDTFNTQCHNDSSLHHSRQFASVTCMARPANVNLSGLQMSAVGIPRRVSHVDSSVTKPFSTRFDEDVFPHRRKVEHR